MAWVSGNTPVYSKRAVLLNDHIFNDLWFQHFLKMGVYESNSLVRAHGLSHFDSLAVLCP